MTLKHIPSKGRSFLVTALLVWAAACSARHGSSDGASTGYTKIDDMEGPGPIIEWSSPPGMPSGFWTSSIDCTEGERISPVPYFVDPHGWSFATYPTPHETFPGITSSHAARLRTTSPLVGIWGAAMGFDLSDLPSSDGGQGWPPETVDGGASMDGHPCRQPTTRDINGDTVDLSAYSGITFWAMADTNGDKTIRVQLNDENTDPRGGICNAANPSSEVDCYNSFGVDVALTDTLTRYTVDFLSLEQNPAWGYRPNPSVVDLQHIYGLIFQVNLPSCTADSNDKCAGGTPSVAFDFWIDDLYFVNK